MSSAGQIVGGIVGGIVGFFVGGPAGAVKGIYIGSTIGGVIDPPKGPTIRGPRLDDLSVQTATYGSFIPRVYGTVAIHGNVFWVQGDKLIEEKKVTDSGGKGGPTQTTETFEYFATFAVGLCEGPIAGVRRIWIGGQLWYDAGSNDVNSIIVSNENANGFTFYAGSDTQLADPLIQADKGASNVPAYRGEAYIVFERLPLANYSNSLMGAQVKVEVVKTGAKSTVINEHATTATEATPKAIAISGHHAYVANYSSGVLQAFNIATGVPLLVGSASMMANPVAIAIDDVFAYVVGGGGTTNVFNISNPQPVLFSSQTTSVFEDGIAVKNGYAYVTCSSTDSIRTYSTVLGMNLIGITGTGIDPTRIGINGDFLYVCCTTDTKLYVYDIRNIAPVLASVFPTVLEPMDISFDGNIAYVITTGSGSKLLALDISNPFAITQIGEVACGGGPFSLDIHGDYAYVVSRVSEQLQVFDISVPSSPTFVTSKVIGASPEDCAYASGMVYTVGLSNTIASYYFSNNLINSTSVQLSNVIESECLKSKLLTASDIDVTELTDTVRGYRIPALGAIRSGLDPLRAAWPFDVVQSGYKIKFKKRGGASVATITAGELDAHAAGDSPGVSITDSREMDLVLPYKVGVKYLDTTREYDTNEQYAERLNTDAVNETAIDLPIVFTANEAAGKAETLLYMYWLERYDVTLKLPPSYAHLEPGDVITVEATHATYSLRLTSVNHTPEGRLECQAKYNSASIYTPAAQGSEGASVGVGLTLAGPSAYQLLDIPMLRDADNVPGFPVAMTGYLAGWPGGVLFRSEDAGETWLDIIGFKSPGTVMGYATNALGAHGGTVYDFASTMTVRLYQGTLSSVTEAQLFAAQNWFAYGKDGRWEIIAARTATLQADGSYSLRDFLRGQLGTEWATGQHAANDSIVRLNAANLEFVNVNSNTIGSERNYRGITAGKALDSDSNRAFTYRGVNLECLSPVHATGDRDPGTNDWNITWVRRSRFAGWRDLVDASLGETTESYEIDIFSDNTYATLKRTLTSVTPNVIYTSANQVTDFGANQPTIYLKIYQLSSVVGRGYPLTISLTR